MTRSEHFEVDGPLKVARCREKGYSEAVVLAVGPGRLAHDSVAREPLDVRVGDRVLVQDFSDSDKVPGFAGKCYLVSDYNIAAVVEED